MISEEALGRGSQIVAISVRRKPIASSVDANGPEGDTMNHRSKRYLTGAYALSTVLIAPTVAGAATSTQGDDYSQDYENATKIKVCDMESDGKKVHADLDLTFGYGFLVEDGDGGGNACAYGGPWKTPNNQLMHIQRHRTVESAWLGDLLGEWVYTGW